MLRMFSTPVFPFWINRATTPATRGADMLVPDARIVPPPFCKVTMPTEETPQVEVTVSESSPGAETVIPILVVGLNFPSVVYQEAVFALIAVYVLQELVPFSAGVLATAKTSGYVAGTRNGTSTDASLPAALTTTMPRLYNCWTAVRYELLSLIVPARPRLILTTLMLGVTRFQLAWIQFNPAMIVESVPVPVESRTFTQ